MTKCHGLNFFPHFDTVRTARTGSTGCVLPRPLRFHVGDGTGLDSVFAVPDDAFLPGKDGGLGAVSQVSSFYGKSTEGSFKLAKLLSLSVRRSTYIKNGSLKNH